MDSSSSYSINLNEASNISEGEAFPDQDLKKFEKIEKKELHQQLNAYKNKGKIPIDKFIPILNNITSVSQHNYNVSQNLIIQLNQLKERYLRAQQDLACSQSQKNELKKNFDLYIQKNTDLLHRKELEYEKICIINNNFSTENEMIKSVLREKDSIIIKKNELIERLENDFCLLENEFENNKIDYKSKIEVFTKENLDLKENLMQVKLAKQSKEDEISKFKENSSLQIEQLESTLSTLRSSLQCSSSDLSLLRSSYTSLLEKTSRLEILENDLTTLQKVNESLTLENKMLLAKLGRKVEEGGRREEDRRRTEEEKRIEEENRRRMEELERRREAEGRWEEERKREEERREDERRRENGKRRREEEEREKEDMERKEMMELIEKEREKDLKDFNEVKLKYEKFIDSLQKNIREQNLKLFKLEEENKDLALSLQETKRKEDGTKFILQTRETLRKNESNLKERSNSIDLYNMSFRMKNENSSLSSNIDFELKKTLQKNINSIIAPSFQKEEAKLEDEWSNIFATLENINKYEA